MNSHLSLTLADELENIYQWRIWRNGLPFAHHALRVDNLASQHGATVHRKLQNVNNLFSAIHFHVRACRHIKSATLGFLWRFVIKHTPKRPHTALLFHGGIVNVNDARIGACYLLPFGLGRCRPQQHQKDQGWKKAHQLGTNGRNDVKLHDRYYKVAQPS